MTREELEEYWKIGLKVESLQNRIHKLEEMAARYEHGVVKGSNPDFPYQEMHFHVSGYNIRDDEKKRTRIYSLKKQLEEAKQLEEDKRLEVEEFINEIGDTTTQLIFTYYYLERMTQEWIGEMLHMERSAVSKRIERYLKMSHNSHS